jgi:hypothetical protein
VSLWQAGNMHKCFVLFCPYIYHCIDIFLTRVECTLPFVLVFVFVFVFGFPHSCATEPTPRFCVKYL